MKVLMITGDKNFKPGSERYDLQKSAVAELAVVYWGRGSLWPKLPAGDFDVVTAQDPFLRGLFGWWVAKRTGANFNVQVHTDLSVYRGMRQVLAQIVLKSADSVRVVSQKIKQQVEHMGVKAPITVLPIFVDIERFKKTERKEHAQKTILWIGRLEREKDPEEAIRIFKQVQQSFPDAVLVILGEGSQGRYLKAAYNLKNIKFDGWQDPLEYFETADVILCTSMHESWGASIVEALAAGVPVVAPDVGVAKEAGALVVPRNNLAGAVVTVLKEHTSGELKLPVPDKEEWITKWKESLQ